MDGFNVITRILTRGRQKGQSEQDVGVEIEAGGRSLPKGSEPRVPGASRGCQSRKAGCGMHTVLPTPRF